MALQHGAVAGSAGEGRFAAAARADYADAAAIVVSTDGHAGKVYELGGDTSFTLAELAAEVSRQSGETVVYNDLSEQSYEALLKQVGLPAPIAHLLADFDSKASHGELDTDSTDLRQLIGRPTTTLAATVASALAQ